MPSFGWQGGGGAKREQKLHRKEKFICLIIFIYITELHYCYYKITNRAENFLKFLKLQYKDFKLCMLGVQQMQKDETEISVRGYF